MTKNGGTILIVDDDVSATRVLSAILAGEGMHTLIASSSGAGIEVLHCNDIDAVVTDLKMPDIDSIALLDHIQRHRPEIPVIIMTAYGSPDSAAWAMSLGAFYYFLKPPEYPLLKGLLARAIECKRLKCRLRTMEREKLWGEMCRAVFPLGIPCSSGGLEKCREGTESVLLFGEPGVGRHRIARALHLWRCGPGHPFIVCSARMEDAAGVRKHRSFKERLAQDLQDLILRGGTLFLDGVDFLDTRTKALLAQQLSDNLQPSPARSRLRIIASTSSDLDAAAAAGRFPSGLLELIGQMRVEIPPLRCRTADIPLLAHICLQEITNREGRTLSFAPAAMRLLQSFPWPGNLRQLRSEVEGAADRARGETIEREHLSPDIVRYLPEEAGYTLKELEDQAIRRTFEASRGNKARTARLLGLSRKTLYKRLSELSPPAS